MRSVFVVAAAACLLALAVAMEAPPTLLDRQLDALTAGRLRLADPTGTLWNGAGTLVLQPNASRFPVRWHIDALPLLRARVRGTLARDGSADPQAAFELASDEFAIHQFNAAFPAEALLRAGGVPTLFSAAGGSVEFRADDFAMRRGVFDGGFTIRWKAASMPGLRSDARVELGEVHLDGTGAGTEIRGTLSNAGGDVEVTGTLSLAATGAARVDTVLKPRPNIGADRSKAILTALSMVGTPDPSGGFRVLWQTSAR